MHIPLAIIPYHGPTELPILPVALNLDPQTAIHLQPQQHLVLDHATRRLPAIHALQLQLLQARVQIRHLGLQPLGLDLGVRRRLGDEELLRVQAGDLVGVRGRAVAGGELCVLRGEGGLLTGEAAEGVLGVAQAQVAGLVEGREGLGDARDGGFVGGYVEVGYCVPDELGLILLVMVREGTTTSKYGNVRLTDLPRVTSWFRLLLFVQTKLLVPGGLCLSSAVMMTVF
jgi:hypothetical protein